jgi:hypothetical protein
VAEDRPVVDQEISGAKRASARREREANDYAFALLRGAWSPEGGQRGRSARSTAGAHVAAAAGNVDPGHVLLSWAWDHGDFASARLALKRAGLSTGAHAILTEHFDRFVDVGGASESDRALLCCSSAHSGANASTAR